jgi:hypothetical protein
VRAVAGLAVLGNMASSIRCGSLQRPLSFVDPHNAGSKPHFANQKNALLGSRAPYAPSLRQRTHRHLDGIPALDTFPMEPLGRDELPLSGHHDRSADDLAGVHVGVGLFAVLDRVRRGLDLDLSALGHLDELQQLLAPSPQRGRVRRLTFSAASG